MQDILSVLRHFSAILFKFINQCISLSLCSIHFWKALDVRINNTLAFLLIGDIWKAQNFNASAGIKWRLYLRARPKCSHSSARLSLWSSVYLHVCLSLHRLSSPTEGLHSSMRALLFPRRPVCLSHSDWLRSSKGPFLSSRKLAVPSEGWTPRKSRLIGQPLFQ